ncbi:DinB family protein [Paludisphaera mucosa]|uniref:DinB family protein n=1 Tax=Paludisphaera mucosa TaxID=3030827 RepID=A0ABT6FK31_9BACT|nr:DinB family protein [Paludisphaera mucosa]MDG3007899.1 DinB family protein [Paludisphaera mucosa]
MTDALVETWQIHNRINLCMLDAIAQEHLADSLGGKGRTAFGLFAHMHNVRLMWLKASAPELLEGLSKVEGDAGTKADLAAALTASGAAVGGLLADAVAKGGRVKGFKPHVTAFLGYLISHESHHRGQAGWALKANGHPLDRKTAFGLWEWGVR